MSAAVVVFVLGAIACVVAHVAILVSVVRHRPTATATDGVPRPRASVETIWALLPILVLAFVLTATWARVREHAERRPDVMIKLAK